MNKTATYRPKPSYYSAAGQKLMTEVSIDPAFGGSIVAEKTRIYLSAMVLKGGEIEFLGTAEGRALSIESLHKNPDGQVSLPNYIDASSNQFRYEYQLKDHLGNLRVACRCGDPIRKTNGDIAKNNQNREPIRIVQQNDGACPVRSFGDAWRLDFGTSIPIPEALEGGAEDRFQYNSKERIQDLGIEMYDYGARHYDAAVGRWNVVDPHADRYPSSTPYNYVYNNPINGIDPDGRDGILIVFPNYKVDTETRLGKQPLGHAGVLLIDNKTGYTKYYEYGRYQTDDGTKGKVRTIAVPNVVIGEDGKPTQESLNKVLGRISGKAGQGGAIEGAYVEGDFTKMNDYAQEKLKESNPQYEEYDKERKPYSLTGNNCGTFGCDVLKQDSDAKKKAPWIFNPTPNNIAEEYQDNFPAVNYDPKTKTTTSEIYKKKEE